MIGGVGEDGVVACGMQAEADFIAGRSFDPQALGADGDASVVTHADEGALAPDVGPPRTVGRGANDGTVFGESLRVGLARGLAEFAVDFMLVGVGQELVVEVVVPDEFADLVGGQAGHEPFLPVVVPPLDLAWDVGA